ncbi:hypothetical protein L2Y96_22675 [Luteibacter aegosomaticola]|uniref:hypothetical protein n=1 Tax=Luteibacter aegosomaticola TaxID=2911538 RepID=UPI001FFA3DAA|nr:hypothetical protein [Luteibacter aegosomaticola]UPG90150.1 hypothetical protein L2Y96_22675 [Luteibacter aegosomaticola]
MKCHAIGLLAIIALCAPVITAAKPATYGCDRAKPEAMLNWLQKIRPTLDHARVWLSSCTHVVGPDEVTTRELRTDNSRLFPYYDETRLRIIGGEFR